jgi:hypothetical protein
MASRLTPGFHGAIGNKSSAGGNFGILFSRSVRALDTGAALSAKTCFVRKACNRYQLFRFFFGCYGVPVFRTVSTRGDAKHLDLVFLQ